MSRCEKPCKYPTGKEVRSWQTGDDECNAYSTKYECGGVYNNNYMDIVGNRDHDCFWDCSRCVHKIEGQDNNG